MKECKTNPIVNFIKKEVILCVASVLAIVSCFFVTPDKAYLNYIDFRTLMILFTLMCVMEGFKQQGIFDKIAGFFLGRADNVRALCFIMVFLNFFSAMLITNDVALITFVPFTILLLGLADQKEWVLPIVILETIGANLGSMLTPVGNPQNLYLYTTSGMNLLEFLKITAPITAVSAGLLFIACLFIKREPVTKAGSQEIRPDKIRCLFFLIVFILSLGTVLEILPVWVPFVTVLTGTCLLQRKVLAKVDYCLLLTFISFFLFIGNMGRIPAIREWLISLVNGREMLVAFFSSQIISNVPAAILLSGFTTEYEELIKGVNIGGLGTLIASMASLISYKYFAAEYPDKKGKYLLHFTIVNVVFAIVLILFTKL